MSTFLSKLFKPKWQSKNKTVRLEAIAALSDSQDEEKQILVTAAKTDSDSEVRNTAIQKLSDSQTLANLHKDATPELRTIIEERLQHLANSQSLSIFDLVIDNDLLTEMITSASNPDPFINGLARIEDAGTLLSIAMKGKTSKIRQAASELINSEPELKTLVQEVKSKDKSVYQIAKSRLDRLRKEAKALAEQAVQIDTILQAIEEHISTENTKLYESRLESLNQRWSAVSSYASSESNERFNQAKAKCEQRILENKQEEEARTQADLMAKAGGDEQKATLLTLEQTLNQFREQAAATNEISALDALIKTQENRWLEATRQSTAEKAQIKHYQVLMTELRQYLKALQKLNEVQSELQDAIEEINELNKKPQNGASLARSSKALGRLLGAIQWPNHFAIPEVIEKANQALGISKDINQKLAQNAEQVLADIESKIKQLDSFLDDKQIKQSGKTLKQIQSLTSRLGSAQSEKVHNQLNLRIKQLNELRDWQGFASSPRQQELCEQMERLADQTLAPLEKADKIKSMQKEWKTLGGAKDEQLWLRFKAASDKAYEPCKAYFDEQGSLKQNNLNKRQTLVEQLDEFIEKNDWSTPDWKAVDQINKKARQEWRDAYPVDHKACRTLQKQFNQALEKLDGYLGEERKRNLALKTSIVEQAEAIKEDDDLLSSMNLAKDLQKQWQAIGITEHKPDRVLWKRFRIACDAIFARRNQEREANKAEQNAAQAASQALLSNFEQKLSSLEELSIEDTKNLLDELRQENKTLPPLKGKALEQHQSKFETLVKQAKQHVKALKHVALRQAWKECSKQALVLRKAYFEKEFDEQAIETQINFSVLPKEVAPTLKEAWISIKANALNSARIIDENQARELCIRCEIASGIDSPENDKDLRMQLQVTRLSEGLSASEHLSREEQLVELLHTWYTSFGLSEQDFEQYEQRIVKCVDSLF